jgi:hypothetical protein
MATMQEPTKTSDEVMPTWAVVLLWSAVPISLVAVIFGIPWIIGYLLRTMLGTVLLQF